MHFCIYIVRIGMLLQVSGHPNLCSVSMLGHVEQHIRVGGPSLNRNRHGSRERADLSARLNTCVHSPPFDRYDDYDEDGDREDDEDDGDEGA